MGRLLCLHGLYGNGAGFKRAMEHVIREFPEHMFEFVSGPFQRVPKILRDRPRKIQSRPNAPCKSREPNTEPLALDQYRAWWPKPREITGETHIQLVESLKALGPFDGLIGFSQGASVASWLCRQTVVESLGWRPKVAVFISGYIPPSELGQHHVGHEAVTPKLRNQLAYSENLHTLHVFGQKDQVVPIPRSISLAQQFVDAELSTEGDIQVEETMQKMLQFRQQDAGFPLSPSLQRISPPYHQRTELLVHGHGHRVPSGADSAVFCKSLSNLLCKIGQTKPTCYQGSNINSSSSSSSSNDSSSSGEWKHQQKQ